MKSTVVRALLVCLVATVGAVAVPEQPATASPALSAERPVKPRPAAVRRSADGGAAARAKLPGDLLLTSPVRTAKPRDRTLRKASRDAARRRNTTSTPLVLSRQRATTAAASGRAESATVARAGGNLGYSSVTISADLNCTAEVTAYAGHPSLFYGGDACATIAFVDGIAYGPASIPAGPSLTAWTPVSQRTTGAGTVADPYVTTTVAAAGDTGVTITQTDTYAPNTNVWTTSVTIANPRGASVARVTHARDCYVAESDQGIGQARPAEATTFCEGVSAALGLVAASPDATWIEDQFSTVWTYATTGDDLPNTYISDSVDNGQAVSWALDPSATSQT
ncbi:MAG TPA: hypothetical protein VF657_21835, partial [Actinoplanes sp.]